MLSQCANRGQWRCHELQVSILNKNQLGRRAADSAAPRAFFPRISPHDMSRTERGFTSHGHDVGRIWKPHMDATERPRMNARPRCMFELRVLRYISRKRGLPTRPNEKGIVVDVRSLMVYSWFSQCHEQCARGDGTERAKRYRTSTTITFFLKAELEGRAYV